eukprot:12088749-Alexandrium_andersonii.AAC.1
MERNAPGFLCPTGDQLFAPSKRALTPKHIRRRKPACPLAEGQARSVVGSGKAWRTSTNRISSNCRGPYRALPG